MNLKFALAVLHFNVQYVAGGMTGFGVPNDDRTAEQVEDQIITESFEPVLDLFLAHPTWGHDVEMQGYMLELIAARHPAVLAKLQTLTGRGQLEVMSFHYSDQLFTAFPRAAWDWSVAKNRSVFLGSGVPLSGAVFCQEGQAGFGMAGAMKDNGYDVLVWPKNLFTYQLGEAEPELVYTFGERQMITSRDLHKSFGGDTVDVTWTFVDDGELLATGGQNPYFPTIFKKSEKAVKAYETKLTNLETNGYAISKVSTYVSALRGVLPTPPPAPPMLDGTWQPNSTDGIHKWLGGRGVFFRDERDNDVRSLQALAQRELTVATALTKRAGVVPAALDDAWRLLALGEVSDASGINPFRGEVEYGIAHAAEALRIAREVIATTKAQLGLTGGAWLDAIDGSATAGAPPSDPSGHVELPIAVTADAGERAVTLSATKLEDGHFLVVARVPAGTDADGSLSVRFPGSPGDVIYTPGLMNAPVHVKRDGLKFEHFYLALSDGLLGLGGGWTVVKDQASVHVAAKVTTANGDVTFADETAHGNEATEWRFHLVQGDDARAAKIARGLNVTPRVWR